MTISPQVAEIIDTIREARSAFNKGRYAAGKASFARAKAALLANGPVDQATETVMREIAALEHDIDAMLDGAAGMLRERHVARLWGWALGALAAVVVVAFFVLMLRPHSSETPELGTAMWIVGPLALVVAFAAVAAFTVADNITNKLVDRADAAKLARMTQQSLGVSMGDEGTI